MHDCKTLYCKDMHGKTRVWSVSVEKGEEYSTITISHGEEGGKKIVTKRAISAGKNVGKSNATTHYEQAVSEARSKFDRKLKEGYSEDLEGVKTLRPMLALEYSKRSKSISFPCYVQPKYDGVRALYHGGKFITRTGNTVETVRHIGDSLRKIPEGLVLDGELYIHGEIFQNTVSFIKRFQKRSADVKYYVYDCFRINGNEPFYRRLEDLKKLKDKVGSAVVISDTATAESDGDVEKIYTRAVKNGYEGVMMRNKNGPYVQGKRSKDLQKMKPGDTDEFRVASFSEGAGTEQGCVVWELETKDGKLFRARGTGTHEQRREEYKTARKCVGKMATVKFQGLSASGIPRFPVFLTMRDYE